MTNYPTIERIAQLQQMIADFAKVKRVPFLADNNQPENDVEHSYGLAITCWFLHDKIAPELDLLKIFQYSLAHDIVELHAGDTYIFDKERVASKDEREREALKIIAKDWHDFDDLSIYANGYMDKVDEEARFVKAIDKLLPVLMIDIGVGRKHWKDLGITLDMEIEHKKSIRVSSIAAPYYELLIKWLDERDNIPKS